MTEEISTGKLLADVLHRSLNFDWNTHIEWLWNKSASIKKLNKNYPINLIYRVKEGSHFYEGCVVFIDGYTDTMIGVCPLGVTLVRQIQPHFLEDVTDKVHSKEITEDHIAAMLAKIAVDPPLLYK